MKIKILRIAQSAVFFAVIGMQSSDVEGKKKDKMFFDEMDTVVISSRSANLAILMESFVLQMRNGDRPVRRYFGAYSSPFNGIDKFSKALNYTAIFREDVN